MNFTSIQRLYLIAIDDVLGRIPHFVNIDDITFRKIEEACKDEFINTGVDFPSCRQHMANPYRIVNTARGKFGITLPLDKPRKVK